MKINRIALFASGNGSNAIKILDYFDGHHEIEVALIVTNNPSSGVLERTKNAKIKQIILNKNEVNNGDFLTELMQANQIDFIVLSGYLKLVPKELVQNFRERIINIHPSLLPKFGGAGMYGMHVHKAVKYSNEKESGITIHLVTEEYDKGRVLAQHTVEIAENDTVDMIQKKVQRLEHEWFSIELENYILQSNS